jgi:uncharacterized membrane protein YccF (DUF307 family)
MTIAAFRQREVRTGERCVLSYAATRAHANTTSERAPRHGGNVLWFILAGWLIALGHLITGVLLCITIIGIPLGVASFKMAGAALVPFGKETVDLRSLQTIPPGAIVVGQTALESGSPS